MAGFWEFVGISELAGSRVAGTRFYLDLGPNYDHVGGFLIPGNLLPLCDLLINQCFP